MEENVGLDLKKKKNRELEDVDKINSRCMRLSRMKSHLQTRVTGIIQCTLRYIYIYTRV